MVYWSCVLLLKSSLLNSDRSLACCFTLASKFNFSLFNWVCKARFLAFSIRVSCNWFLMLSYSTESMLTLNELPLLLHALIKLWSSASFSPLFCFSLSRHSPATFSIPLSWLLKLRFKFWLSADPIDESFCAGLLYYRCKEFIISTYWVREESMKAPWSYWWWGGGFILARRFWRLCFICCNSGYWPSSWDSWFVIDNNWFEKSFTFEVGSGRTTSWTLIFY